MKKQLLLLCLLLISSISFSQSKIFKAIQNDDVNYVSEYIKKGKDLNVVNNVKLVNEYDQKTEKYSYELFEYAANHGNEEIIKLFLSNKDKFSNFQISLNKAFAASISNGKLEITKLLFEAGADVNSVCNLCYGQTAIQIALEYSYFDIFNFLLKNGADLKVQNSNGRTLLHSVSHTGNVEVAKILIDNDLDINAEDNDGATPLIYAAINGNLELFMLLVDKGANLSAIENDSSDVLMNAASGGNLDIVNYLLNKNFNVNYQNKDGDTPLLFATIDKQLQVVKLLIDKGADIDLSNKKEETALLWAIWNDDAETAKFLVDNGANLFYMDYLKQAKKYIKDKDFIKYLAEKTKK